MMKFNKNKVQNANFFMSGLALGTLGLKVDTKAVIVENIDDNSLFLCVMLVWEP
ncbi:hypothetical protein [uncultured Veillonella sp.]|uniref:hypothetical protein n=1 Tax=uncultured Veillonella sp. TaxID=159268 RepID=UPI0025942949|nr:hypothetical protein [uncultured Veillonella sp.]